MSDALLGCLPEIEDGALVLDMATGSAAAVISRFGLLSFGEPAVTAAEMARVLAPGGRHVHPLARQLRYTSGARSVHAGLSRLYAADGRRTDRLRRHERVEQVGGRESRHETRLTTCGRPSPGTARRGPKRLQETAKLAEQKGSNMMDRPEAMNIAQDSPAHGARPGPVRGVRRRHRARRRARGGGPRRDPRSRGSAALVLADLADSDAVRDLVRDATTAAGGYLDMLVNNADEPFSAPTEETSLEDFGRVVTLNVRAPFQLTAELAPAMARRGYGVIVNITGTASRLGVPGLSVYGAAKAAMASLTRTWAAEYGPLGVRLNALELGSIRTPRTEPVLEFLATYTAPIPARRIGQPDEVAEVIAFLASPGAAYMHGAVIPVDGGQLITQATAAPAADILRYSVSET